MPETQEPYEVPNGIECPRCKHVIQFGQGVTPGAENHFRKGLIMVCANCALVSMVGDSKLIPMSKQQVLTLPKLMQAQLMAVCQKIAAEKTSKTN